MGEVPLYYYRYGLSGGENVGQARLRDTRETLLSSYTSILGDI